MLELLPVELIRLLCIEYLDESDRISLVLSHLYVWNTMKTVGYLENIHFDNQKRGSDITELFYVCKRHEATMKCMNIKNLNNPHLWLPFSWPEAVLFNNCLITSKIDNKKVNRTKYVGLNYDTEFLCYTISKSMFINFPCLKRITVHHPGSYFANIPISDQD